MGVCTPGGSVDLFQNIRLLYRFFGPQYNYVTESVEQKPDAIVDIKLTPAGRRMRHAPGQFLYISLDTDAVSEEPHPFSISSPPDSPILRLSIKCLGDWTRSIHQIKPGERARVFGPYGHFSDEFFDHPDLPAVLIGGGIGITPMLSILHSQDLKLRKGPVQAISTRRVQALRTPSRIFTGVAFII